MKHKYYQDDHVTIYHGDCREIAPNLIGVDAVITDPPYGIGYNPKQYKKWNGDASSFTPILGDDSIFDPRPLLEYPVVVLWGANNYTQHLPKGGWLCWDKRCGENADKMVGSPFELAWISVNGNSNVFKIARLQHGGVINADGGNANNETRDHPTQKPVKLMKWCIKMAGMPTNILDPYAGIGSTGRAAKDLGLKCTLIEIEERYCEIAAKRMAQEVLF